MSGLGREAAARNFVSAGSAAEEAAGGELGRGAARSARPPGGRCQLRTGCRAALCEARSVCLKGILRSRLLPPERLCRRAGLPRGRDPGLRAAAPGRWFGAPESNLFVWMWASKSPAVPELGRAAESRAVSQEQRALSSRGRSAAGSEVRGWAVDPGWGSAVLPLPPAGSPVELAGRSGELET